jgi:hypothetical protein
MTMFSFLTPYMTYLKLAGCAALVAAGAYGGYRFELGRYETLVAANATAYAAGVKASAAKQKAIDGANQADAVAQAYFAGGLAGTVVTLKVETPANVTILQDQQAAAADHGGCVTFGFARVLYAGAHGVTAGSLDIPSGESVDTCTALNPSGLASAVAQDLAAGFGNGHQLDALIGAVQRNDAIVISK